MFSPIIHLPDSKIAQSYKQGLTKIKHVTQFGIAPFMKEQTIRDFKLQPFVHSCFKLSSDRPEDYTKLQELTEVAIQYVSRHSLVQWLTMKYVVIRIIDQWSNLEEDFLRFIPKQKEFKRSINSTK